jgi:hypothetical protein
MWLAAHLGTFYCQNMHDNKHKIHPPLYLIGKKIYCWNCDSKMPAIALLAPNVDDTEGEVCILSDIQELPKNVYFFIKNRVPSFRMKYSKTAGHKYLGNTCPKCGFLSGEFFLHAEPGGPFFPVDENDAKSLYIREIPLKSSIIVRSAISTGIGEMILTNAKQLK